MMVISSILGTSSTKSNIIEVLSEEWPLTARKIYFKLKKSYSSPITYQATHKALKELTEKKVIEKTNKGYILSKEWIKDLGNFSEKLFKEMASSQQKREIKTIQKLTFATHTEFINFHLDFLDNLIKKEGKVEMTFYYRHVPYPHVLSHEQIGKMKKLMPKIRWTIIAKKDTSIGRWCAKQWEKMHVKIKFSDNFSGDRTILLNDYILQIYTSKESIKMWDKAYSVRDIKSFNINSTIENISNPKHKTIITILKDREIASSFKS